MNEKKKLEELVSACRPGRGGHFNYKDKKRDGRKMNVTQNESDFERLENAARSGDGEAQHRLAMIKCAGDLADYPYGTSLSRRALTGSGIRRNAGM